jgi:radical SAM superfamily enzyme YgiQ (UPF0313 family)
VTYDIVLFTGFKESPVKTFGAHKCAHELRLAGFRTLVVNHLHDFDLDELTKILDLSVGTNTLFVGFSNTFLDTKLKLHHSPHKSKTAFQSFLPRSSEIEQQFAEHLKTINPDCKIVVGGCRTFFDIYNPNVDYAVIGYADLSIVNLAQHLKSGTELKKSRRNIHKIIVIDDSLAEGFDFANSSMQWCDDDIVIAGEPLPLEISRGCVFSCKFCNFRLNGKKNLDYLKQYETIKNELLYNYEKYNITAYRLLDDTYNDTKEKIDIMLDIVESLPFRPIFWSYIRLDLLAKHPETINKLVRTGIKWMFFGIETLNKKAGTLIGKGFDPDDQVNTIRHIKNIYGDQVHLHGSFICGLPEESKESINNTMNRLLSGDIPLDSVRYFPLYILKKRYEVWHSQFGLDLTRYGFREITPPDGNLRETVNWESDIMNYEEAKKMCDMFNWDMVNHSKDFLTLSNTDPNFISKYKFRLFKHISRIE